MCGKSPCVISVTHAEDVAFTPCSYACTHLSVLVSIAEEEGSQRILRQYNWEWPYVPLFLSMAQTRDENRRVLHYHAGGNQSVRRWERKKSKSKNWFVVLRVSVIFKGQKSIPSFYFTAIKIFTAHFKKLELGWLFFAISSLSHIFTSNLFVSSGKIQVKSSDIQVGDLIIVEKVRLQCFL